jgi:hypothetical protein
MIPTSFRARLPKRLSYPIGAQALADALAGSPHIEDVSVTFWDRPVTSAAEFRSLLARQEPYKILVAEYIPAQKPGLSTPNDMVERGWNAEKWKLEVYPVSRELRQLTNRRLLELGLPAVVRWLQSSQRPGWESMVQRIELVFDPVEESLSERERGVPGS